jgi:hypothetical protein
MHATKISTMIFNLLVLIGFEYASQPGITEEEKANRLHFAVVGGGPTVGYMLHHVL